MEELFDIIFEIVFYSFVNGVLHHLKLVSESLLFEGSGVSVVFIYHRAFISFEKTINSHSSLRANLPKLFCKCFCQTIDLIILANLEVEMGTFGAHVAEEPFNQLVGPVNVEVAG